MGTGPVKGLNDVTRSPASGSQRITGVRRQRQPAETIYEHVVVYLGPRAARSALDAICRALGRAPESVELSDVPRLLAALRPMMGTLLGNASCRILIRLIERDLGMH